MNTDIRLAIGFFRHPKTIQLRRRLGADAVLALQELWCFAAQNHPRGDLRDMDAQSIALACGWPLDRADELLEVLVDVGWIDRVRSRGGRNPKVLSIHDWRDHQGYVFHAPERKERARIANKAKREKALSQPPTRTPTRTPTSTPTRTPPAPAPDPDPSPSPVPAPDPPPRGPRSTQPSTTNEPAVRQAIQTLSRSAERSRSRPRPPGDSDPELLGAAIAWEQIETTWKLACGSAKQKTQAQAQREGLPAVVHEAIDCCGGWDWLDMLSHDEMRRIGRPKFIEAFGAGVKLAREAAT